MVDETGNRVPGGGSRRVAGAARATLVLAALALCVSCGPEMVFRVHTEFFSDGSVERRVELAAVGSEDPAQDMPEGPARRLGLALAKPELWRNVRELPDRLSAGLFLQNADELFSPLEHPGRSGSLADRSRTDVRRDDHGIFTHWVFSETYGDPLGAAEIDATLDALTAWLADALDEQLREQFGAEIDTARARDFIREDVQALLRAVVFANRQAAYGVWTGEPWRWIEPAVRPFDVSASPVRSDEGDYWEDQTDRVLAWARAGVARALSRPDQPVSPRDLGFWPESAEIILAEMSFDDGDPGQCEELAGWPRQACGLVQVASGFYGGPARAALRFESSVTLPGRVLATNGTVDDRAVRWQFRGFDIAARDLLMTAESIELHQRPLTLIGARREFSASQLLQLRDLLVRRDRERHLAKLVERCREAGNLQPLDDLDEVPDEIKILAIELRNLLDPRIESRALDP